LTARRTPCHKFWRATAQTVPGGEVAHLAAFTSIAFVPSLRPVRRPRSDHFRHPDP
jgi:hypothetical protein